MGFAGHAIEQVGEPGVEIDLDQDRTASIAMISGCARICSPWKPNRRTKVASSATRDKGCKSVQQTSQRRLAALAIKLLRTACAMITGTTM